MDNCIISDFELVSNGRHDWLFNLSGHDLPACPEKVFISRNTIAIRASDVFYEIAEIPDDVLAALTSDVAGGGKILIARLEDNEVLDVTLMHVGLGDKLQ